MNKNIFLSWSGEKSHRIAILFEDLLNKVFSDMNIKTFISSKIESGDIWQTKIINEIINSNYCFLILTEENINKPWLNFEAGAAALSAKENEDSKVIPVILDSSIRISLEKSHSPLRIFQRLEIDINENKSDNNDFIHEIETILKNADNNDYDSVNKKMHLLKEDLYPNFRKKLKNVIYTCETKGNYSNIKMEEQITTKKYKDLDKITPTNSKNQNNINNFKEMLQFWVKQTDNNINNGENGYGERVRFKQIRKDNAIQALSFYHNPKFYTKYISFADNINLIISFFASGQYKGSNVNFVTVRGDDVISDFVNIVYLYKENSLWATYKGKVKSNNDSEDFKEKMSKLGFSSGKTFNIDNLQLDQEEISEDLKELYDYFLNMIYAASNK